MIKLNSLQYKNMQDLHIKSDLSLNVLSNNEEFESLKKEFVKKYNKNSLTTFSFDKEGFLGLFLQLNKKGKIAVSKGECEAVYEAAKLFESLGFELSWLDLTKEGKVDINSLEDIDFIFISSYVMDTFVKTDLEKVKEIKNIKIISNASASFSSLSDAVYFDSYKLTGFNTAGVLLFDEELFEQKAIGFTNSIAVATIFEALEKQNFTTEIKEEFKKSLEESFGDDIYFFVDNKDTLDFTLHFALKNIKAREMIRTLSLDEIHITNGEGCSLGLSKPSRIIQAMGYDETTSRNALSLTFSEKLDLETIKKITEKFRKKYRQIKVLNEQ
ncbi:cysteine desulfurase [Arcobacter sp. YIC-464]|uniref:cysteine desulfurase n=1 Tax=Arcobacter sp. YIC-464 TaxID=3376631 RepID=UPI003C16EF12